MQSPVLLLIFNRPDTTERVFDAIRAARPKRLYVAADGARRDRKGEAAKVDQAREIASQVDWDCELTTWFRDENLGCRYGPTSGIDWFFVHEPEGIILEDDCLPDPSFFAYCDELLAHYRDEPRIMAVCGSSYLPVGAAATHSFSFCRPSDPWGWATWRRAWKLHDDSMEGWEQLFRNGKIKSPGPKTLDVPRFWRGAFSATASGQVDAWDLAWNHTVFKHDGLVAYPANNLISNIGFSDDATHTMRSDPDQRDPLEDRERVSLTFPLSIPATIGIDLDHEEHIYRQRFSIKQESWFRYLRKNAKVRLKDWLARR